MSSRVTDVAFNETIKDRIQLLQKLQLKSYKQQTSGQRITVPSDDPVAMGRIMDLREEKSVIAQYHRNCSQTKTTLTFSFSSIQQIQKLQSRVQELAAKSSSAIEKRSFSINAKEVNQLLEQITNNLNTRHNNAYIFGGIEVDTPPYAVIRDGSGKITDINYNGSDPGIKMASVEIADGTEIEPYTDGTINTNLETLAKRIIQIRNSIESADTAAVTTHYNAMINTDENNLADTLSIVSSKLTHNEFAEKENKMRFLGIEVQASEEADAEMVQSIIQLKRDQVAYDAAIRAGSSILQTSLLDFL